MNNQSILSVRIKQLRNDLNLTQEELAFKLGLKGKSSIANYESGKIIPSDNIKIKMCEIFNCSIDYLLGIIDFKTVQEYSDHITSSMRTIMERDKNIVGMDKKTEGSAVVFIYGTIPAGVPMECIEDIIDTEEIPADMLKGGKQFFGLKLKGTSMFPEYLDGDIIICEKVDDCENGQDCVVMVNGYDGTFKRVFKNENGIVLQPLNPEFEPMIYTNEQIETLPVRVIGRVVELRRKK